MYVSGIAYMRVCHMYASLLLVWNYARVHFYLQMLTSLCEACVYMYFYVMKLYMRVRVTTNFDLRVCKRVCMRRRVCVCMSFMQFPCYACSCDFSAPAPPCFTISSSYCVYALDNMYACFWWAVRFVSVHFCHARVSPFVFYLTISPFTLFYASVLSLHLRLSLLRPPIACVHLLTWMHTFGEEGS